MHRPLPPCCEPSGRGHQSGRCRRAGAVARSEVQPVGPGRGGPKCGHGRVSRRHLGGSGGAIDRSDPREPMGAVQEAGPRESTHRRCLRPRTRRPRPPWSWARRRRREGSIPWAHLRRGDGGGGLVAHTWRAGTEDGELEPEIQQGLLHLADRVTRLGGEHPVGPVEAGLQDGVTGESGGRRASLANCPMVPLRVLPKKSSWQEASAIARSAHQRESFPVGML